MKRAFLAAAAFALASPVTAAETWVLDRAHSEATFQVRHLMSRVSGRFTDFTGTVLADPARPEASTVEFTLKSASVDTDNESRDKHLRSADFFDAETHPEITFRSTRVVARAAGRFDVTGNLTIRGVTKQVTLPVTHSGVAKDPWGNEKSGFETAITLDRKDYGLVWNKGLEAGGLLVGDEVAVSINLQFGRPKPAAAN